jgi:hypothetical protein
MTEFKISIDRCSTMDWYALASTFKRSYIYSLTIATASQLLGCFTELDKCRTFY